MPTSYPDRRRRARQDVELSAPSRGVAAPPIEVVDAAGAGDALAAAYLCARIEGVDPRRALERGVAAASLSCLEHGCALSYPDAPSVVALAAAR